MRKFVSLLACLGFSLTLGLGSAAWAQNGGAPAAGEAPAANEAPAASETPGTAAGEPAADGTAKKKNKKGKPAAVPKTPRKPVAKPVKFVPADEDPEVMQFWGTCGASAAIRLGVSRAVIGSDDDNWLRTYYFAEPDDLVYRDEAGNVDDSRALLHRPIASQNLYKFLRVNEFSRRNFSAIEGAAIGDGIVYWIGSHARRHDGETRPNRRRFFATSIEPGGGQAILKPYGRPVLDLAHKLGADEKMKASGVQNSIMAAYRRLEHLSPEIRGIDIQGLTMAPDGETVWIALRNPVRGHRATLVPIVNPKQLVTGEAPIFGDPIFLPLAGRGISAITWVKERSEYLIVSAPVKARTGYQLHRWSGDPASPPSKGEPLPEALNVQSLVVTPDGKRALLFSDDSEVLLPVESADVCRGKLEADSMCECGRIEGSGPKRFRARWISLESDMTPAPAP